MKTSGLSYSSVRQEELSRLIRLIDALPQETIEGLSAYDPRPVSLNGGKVVIKDLPGHGDRLTVNFPRSSKRNVARCGCASFEYKGTQYEIYL